MVANRSWSAGIRPVGRLLERAFVGQLRTRAKLEEIASIIEAEKEKQPAQDRVQLGIAQLQEFIHEMREALKFFKPKRFFYTLGVVVGILVFLGLFFVFPKWYEAVYLPIAGEPFTTVMRRIPAYYALVLVAVLAGLSVLPFRAYIRLIIIVVVFVAGFVGGHAFWSSPATPTN